MFSRIRRTTGTIAMAGTLAVALMGGAALAHRGADTMAAVSLTSAVGTVTAPIYAQNGGFTLGISPANFTFDAANIGSKVNKAGSGHWHIYVDQFNPASPFSKGYITAGAATSQSITMAMLAKVGVTTGTHTLYVVLANNDHSLITPIASAATVVRLGPSLRLMEMNMPANPMVVPANGSITLHVGVSGFKFAPSQIGKKSVLGQGHYHVYVDAFDPVSLFTDYVTASGATSVQVLATDLAKAGAGPGIHTLYVVLANNDHTLVTPITGDYTTIKIAG